MVDGRFISETSIYEVEMGAPVSIDNLRVHVMSIFDKYNLHKHDLKINKSVKVEEGVYIKVKE